MAKRAKRSQKAAGKVGAHARPEGGTGSGARKMKTSTKVVVVIFAVIMALAMMLPSFASVVASNNQEAAQQENQNASAADSSSDSSNDGNSSNGNADDAAATEGVPDDLQSLAKQYYGRNQELESKLDDDPNNLAALLNLGQNYMSWGYQAASQSKTDDETAYSKGLLDKAIGYFDRYLALNDSNSVKVDRALCQYYEGDSDSALAALQQITTDSPDFAPAWANLGLLYENAGKTDQAKDAYQKAADADPNDEYGAKTFANQRLVQIAASQAQNQSQNGSSGDAASVVSNSSNENEGLTDALAQKSGTEF